MTDCDVRTISPTLTDRGRELSLDDLGRQIAGHAGRISAASCRWLLLIAQFHRREGAAAWGFPSTARWLMHFCGLARRTAVEHIRVAAALAEHAPLAEAMSAGRLSFSQARAISRVAHIAEPSLIEALLMTAEHGTAEQLEFTVRSLRSIDDSPPPFDGETERFSRRWADDSRWQCSARLEPEHGAVVDSALDAVCGREGIGKAAALTRLAEIALAVVADADGQLPALRGDEHAAVVIHLHTTPVTGGPTPAERSAEPIQPPPPVLSTRDAPYAHLLCGPGLPARVVRRLVCAGRIRTLVRDAAGSPLDLGRSQRLVSDKQFAALLLRDGGCQHPGCGSRRRLEAHHVRHWLDGGPTDLANLVLLCEAHHHAHHDGEFRIVPLGADRFRFVRADGRVLYPAAMPGSDDGLPCVAPDAATSRWDGTRLDRHWAVAVLAQGLKRSA